MAVRSPAQLCVHIAFDVDASRWYIVESDVPGLWLEGDDAAQLISKIERAAPELIEANAEEVRARFGIAKGDAVMLTPVFDSPLSLAA